MVRTLGGFSFALITCMLSSAYALPFAINVAPGTSLPTQVLPGQTVPAFYTIRNLTKQIRAGNYIKYLPPNTTQVVTSLKKMRVAPACGTTFDLQPYGVPGDTCLLELAVSGPINAQDPDPHHHLFACFPGGISCAGTNQPLNVSGISGGFIVVGAFTNASDSLQKPGVGFTLNKGTSWTLLGLTPPSPYVSGHFSSASCIDARCLAAGNYEDNTLNVVAAIGRTVDFGATWIQDVYTLAGFESLNFASISCSGTLCIATGQATNSTTMQTQSLIGQSTNNGATFSLSALPLIAPGNLYEVLHGVYCSGSNCIAVGSFSDSTGVGSPVVALSINSGANWSRQTLLIPAGFTSGYLNGVTCQESNCIAIGVFNDNELKDQIAIAISSDTGVTWQTSTLIPPSPYAQGLLRGIDCAKDYCVAVGSYRSNVSNSGYPAVAITQNNGITWSQKALSLPPGYQYGYLNGVDCNSSACVASGYFEDFNVVRHPGVAVSINNGSSWVITVFNPFTGYTDGVFNGAA